MSGEAAFAAAKQLPGPLYVVKAQIHAGGRGKGKFKELGPDAKGGLRLARTIEDVEAAAKAMLGNPLATLPPRNAVTHAPRLSLPPAPAPHTHNTPPLPPPLPPPPPPPPPAPPP